MTIENEKASLPASYDQLLQDATEALEEEMEMELDDTRLDALLEPGGDFAPGGGLDRNRYFRELLRLQHELIKLQDWVANKKLKVVFMWTDVAKVYVYIHLYLYIYTKALRHPTSLPLGSSLYIN
jgi:hypothetical protein